MNSVLWWLGQNTFTVAVMVPFVLLACRLFHNRPAVQHVLWVVVLLKFVTPPVVAWPWTAAQVRDSIWFTPVSLLAARAPVEEHSNPVTVLSVGFSDRNESGLSSAEVGGILAGGARHGTSPGSDWIGISLRIAAGIWIVGAATCFTWQLRRIARHASLVRRGSAAPRPLMDEIQSVARQLGLRPPRALISRGILSPFVWCLGRLRLVWPESLSGRAEIVRSRGVIAHELAHVRRGDHRLAWLELVAGVVWWWNPLFWFVRRRLRETAEMACDALAIATCPESRREYAELLLELSAGFKTGAPAPVLAVSAGTPSSFERRLSMILSDNVSGKVSSWGLLAAIGLALAALPGWSLGNDEPAQSSALDTPAEPIEPSAAVTVDTIEGTLAVFDDLAQFAPTLPLNAAKSSVADDPILRDLIEAGKFDEAKARLEALRAKKAADKSVQEGAFPEKWKEVFSKELPAACLKGIPKNAALSWKMCMSCHRAAKEEAAGSGKRTVVPAIPGDTLFKLNLNNAVPEAIIELLLQGTPPTDAAPWRERRAILTELAAGRPVIGFKGNDRLYFMTFEEQGATLTATDTAGGKTIWKSQFADSLPDRTTEDKWTLHETRDQKVVELTWIGKRARIQYALDRTSGKIIQIRKTATADDPAGDATKTILSNPSAGDSALSNELERSFLNKLSQEKRSPVNPLDATGNPGNSRFAENLLAPLDIADRYLKSVADLQRARSQVARLEKAGEGNRTQKDLDEAHIALELAGKREQLLAGFIKDAVNSARAALATVDDEYSRITTLYKKGYTTQTELDAARARVEEAKARVRQFESILSVVSPVETPQKK